MDLVLLWFFLVALCFAIYFFLDGFTFGVGILQPFLARNESDRKLMIGTVSPFWAASEVWVILGAGVIFSAFPLWYGTLFTGLYPYFVLIVLAFIGRGVSFEYRAEVDRNTWRTFWDITAFICHLLPAVLWGMMLANMVQGLPIGESGRFEGSFFETINLFALLGGLTTLSIFILHGSTYLLIRVERSEALHQRARGFALAFGTAATAFILAFVYWGFIVTDRFNNFGFSEWLFPVAAAINLLLVWAMLSLRRDFWAFIATGLTVVFATATIFASLYPVVQPSTLGDAFDVTARGAASEPYTLRLLTIVTAVFLPLIVAYQGWNFWVFRNRVKREPALVVAEHSTGKV